MSLATQGFCHYPIAGHKRILKITKMVSTNLAIELDLFGEILDLAEFPTETIRHTVLAFWTKLAVCIDGASKLVAPVTLRTVGAA